MKPERKKPISSEWSWAGFSWDNGTPWQNEKGYCALSSVIQVKEDHTPLHWCWLVSFSYMGKRALNNKEIKSCLKDWGIEDFEEDNHEPGIARKFFLPVDPAFRKPCPCKNEEVVHYKGDYFYSRKRKEGSL